jgi:mono/diheme cytochrome c family protein
MRALRWSLAGLFVAGVAWASPWDIDMINGNNFKAYEWLMKPQPVGVIARESTSMPRPKASGYYQNGAVEPVNRLDAATNALINPYAGDAKLLATGERFFAVNCAPCHGSDGKGNGPVTQNDAAKGQRRFLMAAPPLAGSSTRLGTLSDGFIYATIRNGGAGSVMASEEKPAGVAAIGAGMPSHGLLLTDFERWSVVAYIRTLENAAPPPAPAGDSAPADGSTPDDSSTGAHP